MSLDLCVRRGPGSVPIGPADPLGPSAATLTLRLMRPVILDTLVTTRLVGLLTSDQLQLEQ